MKMVDIRIYTYKHYGDHIDTTRTPREMGFDYVPIGSHLVTIPVPRARLPEEIEKLNHAFRAAELQREIDALIAERELLEAE